MPHSDYSCEPCPINPNAFCVPVEPPTFSKEEALVYLHLCQTYEDFLELLTLVTDQHHRYALQELRDLTYAINRSRWLYISFGVQIKREPTIYIDPNVIP
ncbi:hypothetical protein [Tellurirhabdus bombi]|uniref:hypothetical protein n=1 Tax=Tellurirhabdus bombi TaxID=2907205 RepID=UPI001F28E3E4|nr:hypothetical protein [Tellurirhabdus bombi]